MSAPSIEDSFDFELYAEWKAELKAGKAPSGKGVRLSVKDQMWLAKRWLLWKFEPNADNPAKPKKVPYYVGGGRRGKEIGLDTAEDIARLAHVWEANERQREFATKGIEFFVGFALGPDEYGGCWQGLDFDDIELRGLRPLTDEFTSDGDKVPGYVEWSPSGNGIHIIGYGPAFESFKPRDMGIEAYASVRFFTYTGKEIHDAVPLKGIVPDLGPYVEKRLKPFVAERLRERGEPPYPHSGGGGTGDVPTDEPERRTDDEILTRLREIKGEAFIRLYDLGDYSDYLDQKGEPDESSADLALANMLVWRTQNHAQLKRLFMGAAIAKRQKIRTRFEDYVWNRTLAKALRDRAVHIEKTRFRFKAIGDGTLNANDMRAPTMDENTMLASLVHVMANKTVVAFYTHPTFFRPTNVMAELLAHNKTEIIDGNGNVKSVDTFNLWKKSEHRLVVQAVDFYPGEGEFCTSVQGERALNLWRPRPNSPPPDWRERCKLFMDHVAFLVPEPDERERFLNWLAHIEQKPGVLPHAHYLMIATRQGAGRNALASILASVWRGSVALDFDLKGWLTSGFNGHLSRKLLAVVDEINEGGVVDRWDNSQKLKSMVTVRERLLNEKYGLQWYERNNVRWLLFSNHETALPLNDDDRRWNVIRNPGPKADPDYYTALYTAVDDPSFIASVRECLRTRNIEGYNPSEPPPMNEAKQAVIEAGMTTADERVKELAASHPCDLILADDFYFQVFADYPDNTSEARRNWGVLTAICDKLKIERMIGKKSLPDRLGKRRQQTVWILRNSANWKNADLPSTLRGLGLP